MALGDRDHIEGNDSKALALAIALNYVKKISKILIEDYPQLEGWRDGGMTINNIVKQIDWSRYVWTSDRVKYSSVQAALSIIIPKERRDEIAQNSHRESGEIVRDTRQGIFDPANIHLVEAGREKGAATAKERGSGIFGLSRDELVAIGEECRDLGIGIHGMSDDDLLDFRRQGGEASYKQGVGVHSFDAAKRSRVGRAGGSAARDQLAGVHGLTTEELSAAGLKSYKLGVGVHRLSAEERIVVGQNTVRDKLGIHNLSKEDRVAAGKLAAIANGKIPWYMDGFVEPETGLQEGDYCLMLAGLTKYKFDSGPHKGQPKNAKIADALNDKFYSGEKVRKASGVINFLYRSRKKKEG